MLVQQSLDKVTFPLLLASSDVEIAAPTPVALRVIYKYGALGAVASQTTALP